MAIWPTKEEEYLKKKKKGKKEKTTKIPFLNKNQNMFKIY